MNQDILAMETSTPEHSNTRTEISSAVGGKLRSLPNSLTCHISSWPRSLLDRHNRNKSDLKSTCNFDFVPGCLWLMLACFDLRPERFQVYPKPYLSAPFLRVRVRNTCSACTTHKFVSLLANETTNNSLTFSPFMTGLHAFR